MVKWFLIDKLRKDWENWKYLVGSHVFWLSWLVTWHAHGEPWKPCISGVITRDSGSYGARSFKPDSLTCQVNLVYTWAVPGERRLLAVWTVARSLGENSPNGFCLLTLTPPKCGPELECLVGPKENSTRGCWSAVQHRELVSKRVVFITVEPL